MKNLRHSCIPVIHKRTVNAENLFPLFTSSNSIRSYLAIKNHRSIEISKKRKQPLWSKCVISTYKTPIKTHTNVLTVDCNKFETHSYKNTIFCSFSSFLCVSFCCILSSFAVSNGCKSSHSTVKWFGFAFTFICNSLCSERIEWSGMNDDAVLQSIIHRKQQQKKKHGVLNVPVGLRQ